MADEPIMTLSPAQPIEMRPVADLNFHIGERLYRFEAAACRPKDMPYLLQLVVALMSMRSLGPVDVKGYVDEHQLWHCFKER